jgi:hypothetical protein
MRGEGEDGDGIWCGLEGFVGLRSKKRPPV